MRKEAEKRRMKALSSHPGFGNAGKCCEVFVRGGFKARDGVDVMVWCFSTMTGCMETQAAKNKLNAVLGVGAMHT